MGWKKSVLAVCLIVLVALPVAFAEGGAAMQGQAVACFKDSSGVETCVPASQVAFSGNSFTIQDSGAISAAISAGKAYRDVFKPNEPIGNPVNTTPAKVVRIVFYGNLQAAATHYMNSILKQLKQEYGNEIEIEYRPLLDPYTSGAPFVNDELVHEAAECARDQGKFEEFAQQVYETIGQVQDEALLEKHANAIGLDVPKFGSCINSGAKKNVIKTAIESAAKDNAGSRQRVFIEGQSMLGTYQYSDFKYVIDSLLDGSYSPIGFMRGDYIPEISNAPMAPKPKHNFQINEEVARALDFYADNPEQLLHLKIYWWIDPTSDKIERIASEFVSDWGAAVDGIDTQNYFFYATMAAGKVDLASVHYGLNITFDERQAKPPVPSPTPYAWPSPTPTPSPSPSPSPTPVPTAVPTPQTAVEETVSPITANVITVTVSNEAGEKTATVSSEPEGLTIESQGVKASVANGTQVGFGNAGIEIEGKPLGVLPDQALATINPTPSALDAQSIELKTRLFQPVYEVSATKKAKVLGVLPVEYSVNAVVNAQDGSVESMQKPWWTFLAN